MPKFTAMIGDSNRILSVGAATEEQARTEIDRQLRKNSQRFDIWRQWLAGGATIIREARIPATTAAIELDRAAGEAGRILEALAHPDAPQGPDTDEWVTMIESARDLITEAAETLRYVANETGDTYREATIVANLETLAGTGGWSSLESETLEGWIEHLRKQVPA